jgi:hypothetical protein
LRKNNSAKAGEKNEAYSIFTIVIIYGVPSLWLDAWSGEQV